MSELSVLGQNINVHIQESFLATEPKTCQNDQEMMCVICVAISKGIKTQIQYIKTTYLTKPLKPALL